MTNSLIDKNEMDEIIKSLLNQVISSLVLKAFNLNKPARYSVSKSLPIYLNYIENVYINNENDKLKIENEYIYYTNKPNIILSL